MIRYYCNTCGTQVRDLGELTDLRSQTSLRPTDSRLAFEGNLQEHVCKSCIHAIKHFIASLGRKPAPPVNEQQEVTTQVQ